MGLIEDLLLEHNKLFRANSAVLARLNAWLQQLEAEKTPGSFRPKTINLLCSNLAAANGQVRALQLYPRNGLRGSLAIYNLGPADILYGTKEFDPASILQQVSDPSSPDTVTPSYNQMIDIGILSAGASAAVDATGGVWAYNIGSSNALLTMVETIYSAAITDPQSDPLSPGLAGAIAYPKDPDTGLKHLN